MHFKADWQLQHPHQQYKKLKLCWTSSPAVHQNPHCNQMGKAETIVVTATLQPDPDEPLEGLMVLALSEFGYTHLFAFHPENLPLTRLTFGAFDDIHPAISPDGSQIAFASQRNTFWDIYILDLSSGGIIQVTNDANYNGRPTWSPDGQWLAYEKYADDNNLEVFLKPVDGSLEEILLTANAGVDYAPAWATRWPQDRLSPPTALAPTTSL